MGGMAVWLGSAPKLPEMASFPTKHSGSLTHWSGLDGETLWLSHLALHSRALRFCFPDVMVHP